MKKIIIILISLAVLVLSCERTYESKSVGFDAPSEPPSPTGLKVYHISEGLELNWQINDSTVVDYFNIYYGTAVDEEFLLYDTTSAFKDTISALTEGRNYLFQVTLVNTDGVESDRSVAVTAGIGATSVSIDNDAEYTADRQVSLSFVVPSTPSLMLLSEDSLGAGADWRNYTQPASFTVSSGDGAKRIFARFRFADGSESKFAVSDSIILDTRAFVDSVWFESDTSHPAVGDTINFYLDAGESGGNASISFPGVTSLDLYDDGSGADNTADDGIYSRRYIVPLNLEVDNGLVNGSFSDQAGNDASDVPAASRINIVEIVDPISLNAVAEASYKIRLDWSPVENDDFVAYRIYRSTSTGVDDTSELLTLITSPTTASYVDETVDESTDYYYRLYAYDGDGILTNSPEAAATTPANLPPDSVSLGLSIGSEDGLQIVLSWTPSDADDFAAYRIFRADFSGLTNVTGQSLAIINDRNTTTFTDFRANVSDTYYYIIVVYDLQGARSIQSQEVVTP